jgi:hypothetical protein
MALSQARLEAIFEVNATDNTAAVLNKTKKRLDDVGKQAGKVSEQAEGFGDAFAEAVDGAIVARRLCWRVRVAVP